MSLEAELAANTAAIKELTAALLAGGIVKNAQVSAEAHSSPAVQAVVKAQKEADAANAKANPKGGEHESADEARAASQEQSRTASALAAAKKRAAAEAATNASGEQSAPTGESSSQEPTSELQPWAEKTAAKFAELKDAEANLDNVRKAVLGINSLIGREQATAVLGRFGVQAVTPKDNKKGLDESQYEEFYVLCLEVLSGKVDATASMASE